MVPYLTKNHRELLQAGADPNAATYSGETPLALAELSGSFYVVRELLLAGAEPLAAAAATPTGDEGVAAASNADAVDDDEGENVWRWVVYTCSFMLRLMFLVYLCFCFFVSFWNENR